MEQLYLVLVTLPEASLPVMEGKAVLFKSFAGVDAFPIALNTNDVDKIVETVKLMEPTFGGVNLEDIARPNCFIIEERLKKKQIFLSSMMINTEQLS